LMEMNTGRVKEFPTPRRACNCIIFTV